MPSYNFLCKKCNNHYDDLVEFDPSDKYKDVKCPYCKSKRKQKLLTTCIFKFKQPAGTSFEDKFDYKAQYNMEMAKKTRAIAEAKSNQGKNPYNKIDDISSGKHFGKIK